MVAHPVIETPVTARTAKKFRVFILDYSRAVQGPAGYFHANRMRATKEAAAVWFHRLRKIKPSTSARIFVSSAMKMNLIALTFLGLVAVFLAGCAAETTTTTTTRTREESSMYAR